jgi:transposase
MHTPTRNSPDKVTEHSGRLLKYTRAQRRAAAINLLQSGHSPQEVAVALGVSTQTVRAWRRRYEAEGPDGLSDRARSGRPRKADAQYIDTLESTLATSPDDIGYDDAAGWTVQLLCDHMKQETGVRLGHRQTRAAAPPWLPLPARIVAPCSTRAALAQRPVRVSRVIVGGRDVGGKAADE